MPPPARRSKKSMDKSAEELRRARERLRDALASSSEMRRRVESMLATETDEKTVKTLEDELANLDVAMEKTEMGGRVSLVGSTPGGVQDHILGAYDRQELELNGRPTYTGRGGASGCSMWFAFDTHGVGKWHVGHSQDIGGTKAHVFIDDPAASADRIGRTTNGIACRWQAHTARGWVTAPDLSCLSGMALAAHEAEEAINKVGLLSMAQPTVHLAGIPPVGANPSRTARTNEHGKVICDVHLH